MVETYMIRKILELLKTFSVLTALVFPEGAAAQSDEGGRQEPFPCVTNIGPNGELFKGYFSFVSAPAGVHTVVASDDNIFVDPLYSFGTSIMIYPYDEAQDGPSELRFFDENSAEIYSCLVIPEVYDFDRVGVEGLTLGVCPELRRPQPLGPGQINVFDSNRRIGDLFVLLPWVADGSVLEGKDVFVITKSVGVAQFLIFEDRDFLGDQRRTPREEERYALMGSCPLQVVAADDPLVAPDAPTCLLENGDPARGRVDQAVTLQFPLDPAVEFRYIGKGANSRHLYLEIDGERRTVDVIAGAADKYDLLFRSETGDQDEICMLIVDP
jgi:hypothetical protein